VFAPSRLHAVHTEVFDGPLELLLYLVRRDGIDLRQVSIAPITDAYLQHLELMERLDLDLAGEFVVMAATLCWLKSRELLPTEGISDDEERDPDEVRAELTRRLLDYQRYREAAEALEARALLDRDVYARGQDSSLSYERAVYTEMDGMGLFLRYYRMMRRRATPSAVHQVATERYDLRATASRLLAAMGSGPRDLVELLRIFSARAERVLAFIATLELARLGVIRIEQEHHLGTVRVEARRQAGSGELDLVAGVFA
jgi:segregation and condensation protein A